MNIPFLPSEQDDIVNSLNYEDDSQLSCSFTTFLTVTDCVLALSHELNSLND